MIVNRNSWHYQVYDFSYMFSGKNAPDRQTNLCQYMRRLLFVAPFVGFLFSILMFFGVVMVVLFYMFGPIFGWVPKQWTKPWTIFDGGGKGAYKYEGLQIGKSYNAFQLYPWHVILAALVVAMEWVIYHVWGVHPMVVQGEVVGVIVALIVLIIGIFEFSYADSGTTKLVKEYLSAKKQKVCPVVEFKNEE